MKLAILLLALAAITEGCYPHCDLKPCYATPGPIVAKRGVT